MNIDTINTDTAIDAESCELCVIGAGIAGLNALYVATQYLGPNDKVILIDHKPAPGGMWTETYDYVRLHQPHRAFTAGNIDWQLEREQAYLATKPEVLTHFGDCLDTFRRDVKLTEYYGHRYESHREIEVDGQFCVEIRVRPNDAALASRTIRAKRCIKAIGFNVPVIDALKFESQQVRSISPHGDDIDSDELRDSDSPIVIVGGGKTAMDTAYRLITRYPEKNISMIVGKGTIFSNRDTNFPTGVSRWWGAPTSLEAFLDICSRYTGDNNAEVFEFFKKTRTIYLDEACQQFMFGLLSENENETIKRGLSDTVFDYLSDVVDVDGEPRMRLSSGAERAIPVGCWFINCTGYIARTPVPYEPFVSPHGTTVSIQATSAIHFLTTFSSYFLSHLLFLGRLRELPLYEVDFQSLLHKNKRAMPVIAMTHLLYNVLIIADAVPAKVMIDCGLDFDRWFPTYRRLIASMKLRRNRDRYLESFRQALDRSREKYNIRCGELPNIKATEAAA